MTGERSQCWCQAPWRNGVTGYPPFGVEAFGRKKRLFRIIDNIILFIWSQHDGGNVDKEHRLRFPPKPYDAKS